MINETSFNCEVLDKLSKTLTNVTLPEPVPDSKLFDMLCHSIIAQQLAAKAAAAISTKITNALGTITAEKISGLSAEEFRQLGLSRQKISYLQSIASLTLSGSINFYSFASKNDNEIIRELIQAKGIGVWTAEIFLIFALGRHDVFPADDYGLRQAVSGAFSLPSLITAKHLRCFSQRWAPRRSYAAMLLWASLRNK